MTVDSGDAPLVAQLQAGSGEAFEQLLRMQTPALLRTARRFLRSEEDARDAVQDAFISVYRSIREFEATAQLSTWLYRILINCCLMRIRSKRRHPEEDITALLPRFREDGHQVEPSIPWTESPENVVRRRELRELVRAAIDRLPERYRTVVMLRDIEELSTEEAARILGETPNAVKIRLHRARQALRTLLDPQMRSITT